MILIVIVINWYCFGVFRIRAMASDGLFDVVERLRDIKHQDCSNCHKSMKFCVLIVFYC